MVDLAGKRIVLTQADEFMGPKLAQVLRRCGASVLADTSVIRDAQQAQEVIRAAGAIDSLVVNLAIPAPSTAVENVSEDEWRTVFDALVTPLYWLVKAAVPVMKQQGQGNILVMGSASALRGMKLSSTYSAARGAQIAYVQAAGVELAKANIRVNAIAQNFVENPTYFPPALQANPKFQDRLQREVPLGRLVGAQEDAQFAAYLCSDAAACFVGQVFPVCGGWVQR
jgi:2-keto-3-deoxy-L-fuconate dehydrogenase